MAADEDPDMVGPAPLAMPGFGNDPTWGGALRPGEGDAIAQYVQLGKRIPRRGEVGMSAEEIESFEEMGARLRDATPPYHAAPPYCTPLSCCTPLSRCAPLSCRTPLSCHVTPCQAT